MISIKKYIDERSTAKTKHPVSADSGLIESYRSTLVAVSRNATRDGSAHGEELAAKLLGLDRRIGAHPLSAPETQAEVEKNLDLWGKRAAADAQEKAAEMKEILLLLAGATEAIVTRDQKNARRFSSLTESIESVGGLNDIRQIKSTLVAHVTALKTSVEEMTRESRQMMAGLQEKVASYETRLKSAENLALTDVLTGVANRRSIEETINNDIESRSGFAVAIFDLNAFKPINDRFGHTAGDDLLKQFAKKLEESCRASDLVGRWGGDEFVVVLSGEEARIGPLVYRMRDKVCTRYLLHGNDGFLSPLEVDTAVGFAQWSQGETLEQLLGRADAQMYEDKRRRKASFTLDEGRLVATLRI